MKIESIHLSRVRVPLSTMYVSASGVVRAYLKTVVRLVTDRGLVGVGETYGTPEVFGLVGRLARGMLGHDPLDRHTLRRVYGPRQFLNTNGRNGWFALAGVDMACWDLAGKHYELPLYELLGGLVRPRLPMAADFTAAPLSSDAGDAEIDAFFARPDGVDRMVESCTRLVAEHGYPFLKIKSRAREPDWDLRVMTALGETLGRDVRLRHDPNAGFLPAEAVRLYRRLDSLGLQWFEDPTTGIDAMARVRQRVRTPLATNMCVIEFDQLATAARLGAVDVVGVDVFHWGGIANARDLIAVCRAVGLQVFLHSHFELGVATAANLHLAAACPTMTNGVDTCLPIQDADIIDGGGFRVTDGHLDVPQRPGLGVALDEAAITGYSLQEVRADA